MRKIVVQFLTWYKKYASPLLGTVFGNACRFTPTCSEYTIDAVNKKGVVKGLTLGFLRFLRCNPLSKPKHDPVV